MKKGILFVIGLLISTVALGNGFDAGLRYENTGDKFHYMDDLKLRSMDDSGLALFIENGVHIYNDKNSGISVRYEYDLEMMSWDNADGIAWFDIGPVISKVMDNGIIGGAEIKYEKLGGDFDWSELKLKPFLQAKRSGMTYTGTLGIIIRDYDGFDGTDLLLGGKAEKDLLVNGFKLGGELRLRNYSDMETEMKLEGFANYKKPLSMEGMSIESENSIRFVSDYKGFDTNGIIDIQCTPKLKYTKIMSPGLFFLGQGGLDIDFSSGDNIEDGLNANLNLSAGIKYVY